MEGNVMTVNPNNGMPGLWGPDFKVKVSRGDIKKDNGNDFTGWKVDLAWLKEQIEHHEAEHKADPEAGYGYMVFVVTRDRNHHVDWADEIIIDPEKHRLWIRAFGSPESMAEDFPPIQWP
jgi:hypothetical protein